VATWPPPPATIAPWPFPPPEGDTLPGLIPEPARRAGLGRWQIETRWPRGWVASLSWSPDRHRNACAAMERVVRIYEAKRLELVSVLIGHRRAVTAVAWSPDGMHIASGTEDGEVRLWGG